MIYKTFLTNQKTLLIFKNAYNNLNLNIIGILNDDDDGKNG